MGTIHSAFEEATSTPIQPARAHGAPGRVVLDPTHAADLLDLEEFDRIRLVYWFDRAGAAKLKVVPCRNTVEHSANSKSAVKPA